MSLMVLTAAYVSITGAGTIADHTSKAELTAEVEEKDITTFASLGWKEVTGGLKSGSLALSLFNDIVDDGLDEDMWTIFLAGVPVAFEVRLTQAAVGVSNPKYSGLILVKSWTPLNGQVGDVASLDVTYSTSGAITRAVA
jgi:predicted secreted protein